MTLTWKQKWVLKKHWQECVDAIEGNLVIQRAMASEFMDAGNFAAVASIHVQIEADENEKESLRDKIAALHRGEIILENDDE